MCARVEGACWCLVSECVEMIARCVYWGGGGDMLAGRVCLERFAVCGCGCGWGVLCA